MRLQGELAIEAPRERCWAFLTDERQVAQCAPGPHTLKVVDPNRFLVTVKAGVGLLSGTFTFAVVWQERQAPERARVEARGKLPGSSVHVETIMRLTEPAPGRTVLRWESTVQISGLLGGVGERMVQGSADAALKPVFACIKAKLETRPTSRPAGAGSP